MTAGIMADDAAQPPSRLADHLRRRGCVLRQPALPAWLSAGNAVLTWVGVVLALSGFVLIAVGWGQVAGETEVYLQLAIWCRAGADRSRPDHGRSDAHQPVRKTRDGLERDPTDRQVGRASWRRCDRRSRSGRQRRDDGRQPGSTRNEIAVPAGRVRSLGRGARSSSPWLVSSACGRHGEASPQRCSSPSRCRTLVSGAMGGLALAGFALGVLAIQSTGRAEATRRGGVRAGRSTGRRTARHCPEHPSA